MLIYRILEDLFNNYSTKQQRFSIVKSIKNDAECSQLLQDKNVIRKMEKV